MKKITCEMCGSNDLIKQDGVFICQSCGTKYSVEEAKKLMVEGVVQVEGTVRVDNTEQAKIFKDLAISAYNAGNTKEAYQYFLKVLEIEPTDYQCIFYKGMCQGWETSLARPRVGEAVAAYHQAECHIPETIAQEVKEDFLSDLIRLMSVWHDKAFDNYADVDEWYQSNISIYYTYKEVSGQIVEYIDSFLATVIECGSGELIESVGELYCSTTKAICGYVLIWNDYSKQRARFSGLSRQEKQPYLRDYDTMIFEVRKYDPQFQRIDSKYSVIDRMDPPTSIGPHNSRIADINYQKCIEADKAIDRRLQKYKEEILQEQKRKRREEYWDDHLDEKQQYETRLSAINSEIEILQEQDAPFIARIAEIEKELSQQIPEDIQLSELQKQQGALSKQMSTLGLFAGKQKKALQAKLDSLQLQIDAVISTAKRIKSEIRDDVSARVSAVNAERKPISDRINALESEKAHINDELTKDR